jgi:hypothetical protein
MYVIYVVRPGTALPTYYYADILIVGSPKQQLDLLLPLLMIMILFLMALGSGKRSAILDFPTQL